MLPFLVFHISCEKKVELPDNVLLQYGDNTLTYDEVISQIPVYLSGTDSAAMFRTLVDNWIKDNVLAEFAEERLYDIENIDKKVKEYRNQLIVQEYLSKMRDTQTPKVEEHRVKEYYDQHRRELKLEVPLVKGIFMKVNSNARNKEEIKRLIASDDTEKIDKLERDWLDKSLEYNYFRDKWIDWETLTNMIPYRFGDPDKFLSENKYFETEYGDCTYYLVITEYLPTGEEQPYEFAKSWITGILTQGELAEYERVLVESLVNKSIKEKKLDAVGYDPIRHEMKEINVNE